MKKYALFKDGEIVKSTSLKNGAGENIPFIPAPLYMSEDIGMIWSMIDGLYTSSSRKVLSESTIERKIEEIKRLKPGYEIKEMET